MVWVPGGTFLMGSDHHYPEEAPAHEVRVEGFWMDRYAVTNDQFSRFVAATGHVTLAERPPNLDDYPGAKPELAVAASAVFHSPGRRVDLRDAYQWWALVPGADWRHPLGPGSSLKGKMKHPVVHVAWSDVEAYAGWAGKVLPTEAEWERAARGGLDGAEFVWGDELAPGGRHMANTWQGEFPVENLRLDGYEGTAPVGSYPPNGYGLYDMAGNVWQWTSDWYGTFSGDAGEVRHSCCSPPAAASTPPAASFDPDNPTIPRKVMKGGSFLCAPSYCQRYRPAARLAQGIDTSTCHLGFRCIVRPDTAV
jgi:formylglycine-generating enzyme required for sulfatase activity